MSTFKETLLILLITFVRKASNSQNIQHSDLTSSHHIISLSYPRLDLAEDTVVFYMQTVVNKQFYSRSVLKFSYELLFVS